MADFYKALSEGVSEQELRKIFEDELAAAKKKLNNDKKREKIEDWRECLIEDLINYIAVLIDDEQIPDADYERMSDKIRETLLPFEDLILSLDVKHLSNEELERAILELLNK